MKPFDILGIAVVALLVTAACTSWGDSKVDPGTNRAPEFQIEAFGNENYGAGQPISLKTFENKPIVLNFWYPSCPPCRLEMPHFEAAFNIHKSQSLEFIGVQQLGLDSRKEGQEFIEEFGLTYAIGPDGTGQIVRDYSVISFPTTFFLDENHEIVRKWSGPLDEEKLSELIEEILSSSS